MRAFHVSFSIVFLFAVFPIGEATPLARAGEVSWEQTWPTPRAPDPWLAVNHVPAPAGGLASDLELRLPSNAVTWQQLASDFVLSQPGSPSKIVWWGFYNDDIRPASPETEVFRFRLYMPRAGDGLPGNTIWEESVQNPLRMLTGRRIAEGVAPFEFRYETNVLTPTLLLAGQRYWLEIVQADDVNSWFRWEYAGTDAMGQAVKNPATVDWRISTPGNVSDTAFQLWVVPEPSFIGCTLSLLFLCRHRKRGAYRESQP